jgi:hypothetical protein
LKKEGRKRRRAIDKVKINVALLAGQNIIDGQKNRTGIICLERLQRLYMSQHDSCNAKGLPKPWLLYLSPTFLCSTFTRHDWVWEGRMKPSCMHNAYFQ